MPSRSTRFWICCRAAFARRDGAADASARRPLPSAQRNLDACSCPDWAVLCKHVAAVLYGVGARLDKEPELLFQLRAVDHVELVQQALSNDSLEQALDSGQEAGLAGQDLGELFGIELESGGSSQPVKRARTGSKTRRTHRVIRRKRSAPTPPPVRKPQPGPRPRRPFGPPPKSSNEWPPRRPLPSGTQPNGRKRGTSRLRPADRAKSRQLEEVIRLASYEYFQFIRHTKYGHACSLSLLQPHIARA